MREGIAGDHEPGMTAACVVPEFPMRAGRVVALIDIGGKLLECVGLIRVRTLESSVTQIDEFAQVAVAAVGATNSHRNLSMEVGLRAHPLLVDEMAGGETIQTIGGGNRMRLIPRDEMCKAPTRCGSGLEAAVTPAGVEIQPIDWRVVDDR